MGQEFWRSLAVEFYCWVSHEVVVKSRLRLLLPEGLSGLEDPLPGWLSLMAHVLVWVVDGHFSLPQRVV